MSQILNKNLQALRSQINQIVKELQDLCIEIHHEDLANTVSELRNRINEPFMFVIVGEVKAGKSSFINALLNTGKRNLQSCSFSDDGHHPASYLRGS